MPNSTLPPDNYLGDPERTTGEFQDQINNLQNWVNALQAELQALSGTTVREGAVRQVNGGTGPLRANLEPTSNVEFNRVTTADFMQAARFKNVASPGDGDFDSGRLLVWHADGVELGGDFNAGETVSCRRIGNIVVISSDGPVSHSALSSVGSASGVIPSAFRPPEVPNRTPNDTRGSSIGTSSAFVTGAGDINISHRDWSGSSQNRSSAEFHFVFLTGD